MHRHERPCGASCRFCARFLSRPPTAARSPRHILRRTYRHAARRHTAHRHAREGGHPRVEPLLPCCLEGSCSSIPAPAGQPRAKPPTTPPVWAYPRSRGATACAARGYSPRTGLSPLTRGNRRPLGRSRAGGGPIPAHAGQPCSRGARAWPRRAYPRSRGATRRAINAAETPMGLSPLTQGNLGDSDPGDGYPGPIPAHAGQPLSVAHCVQALWAYPRSRGATFPRRPSWPAAPGLSPLTRGNPDQSWRADAGRGPIPAHAGQPCRRRRWWTRPRAYPRSRGATAAGEGDAFRESGLSPLTRGNLSSPASSCCASGPIPAHAGQPCCWA